MTDSRELAAMIGFRDIIDGARILSARDFIKGAEVATRCLLT